MSIRNINNNVYLFDVDDDCDPTKGSKQLSISCVDDTIFLTVVNRTESNRTINYEILEELGFDIPTFVKGLNTAFAASNYDIMLEVIPKPNNISDIPQNIIDVLPQLSNIEQVSMEDSDLFEE
jgi:hypothetical protein